MLHVVFGELAPKSLALQRAEAVSIAIVRPLRLFEILFRPVILVLNGFGRWFLARCELDPLAGRTTCTPPRS